MTRCLPLRMGTFRGAARPRRPWRGNPGWRWPPAAQLRFWSARSSTVRTQALSRARALLVSLAACTNLSTVGCALDPLELLQIHWVLHRYGPSSTSASWSRRRPAAAEPPSKPDRQKLFGPEQDQISPTARRGTCLSQLSPTSLWPTRRGLAPPPPLRRHRLGHPSSTRDPGRLGGQDGQQPLIRGIQLPPPRRRGGSTPGRGRNHTLSTGAWGLRWGSGCGTGRRRCSPRPDFW
mmetsp:Transcript_51228/g.116655  ORF Transcript_51228/g.116655 Transcript_51228/m.116655 type:complete len:235 (+) Transcript_51228:508-1212(+)